MLKQYVFLIDKMATGKAASQTAHATFMALDKQRVIDFKKRHVPSSVNEWRIKGMCVVVLKVPSLARLRDVEKYCKDWNIIHHLYNDESEALKPTCLATGIIKEDDQWMFNRFKLYGGKK